MKIFIYSLITKFIKSRKLKISEEFTFVLRATDLVAEFISPSHRRFESHSLLQLLHTAHVTTQGTETISLKDLIVLENLQNIHFPSFHFTSLHFTSLHFTSLSFISLPFISLHFTSLHFTSLPFISLHFTSLHFTSLPFISLHFTSLHFTSLHFTSLHFTSLHFTSHCGSNLLRSFLVNLVNDPSDRHVVCSTNTNINTRLLRPTHSPCF